VSLDFVYTRLMGFGEFISSFFSIGQERRRRLVEVSTTETRENWFKAYDASEERRLRSRMPQVPLVASTPDDSMVFDTPFPKKLLFVLILLFVASTATLGNRAFAAVTVIIGVWLLIGLRKINNKAQLFKTESILLNPLPLVGLLSVIAGMISLFNRPMSVILGLIFLGGEISLLSRYVLSWFRIRREVKEHNLKIENQRRNYEESVKRHDEAMRTRRALEAEIDAIAIDCLHPDLMARERRRLLDSVLERAFAELGVSANDQRTVLAEKDRFVIEISGPITELGSIQSPYENPIIEFPGLLPSHSENDTPALRRYLAHLYVCKIGLVLPHGFGIYEAVVDSVNQSVHTRSHELLVWKSISRVTRQNAESLDDSDVISIQSYGGSETLLPVNGFFIHETTESVPVLQVLDDLGMQSVDTTPRKMVNSFVLAIQQKMTQGVAE